MARLAYFVTSHGYGHAARSCAVMHAAACARPGTGFHVITTVPYWFFAESLQRDIPYHRLDVDVGMVQKTSLEEDPHATAPRVRELLDPRAKVLEEAVEHLAAFDCDGVVCDISPIGLLAAQRLGLPSILVENFTWDFIYRGYERSCPPLAELADQIAQICRGATIRVQTRPKCVVERSAISVEPVSRSWRRGRHEVRRALGVPDHTTLVLLTMGGIDFDFGRMEHLAAHPAAHFVVPGGADSETRSGHLLTLPHHSEHYHPDLVAASDLVVGKVGYSTLAEVFHSTAAFAFVPRLSFPESPVLAAFAEREMAAVNLVAEDLDAWRWLDHIDELVARRSSRPPKRNGAEDVAQIIFDTLDHRS